MQTLTAKDLAQVSPAALTQRQSVSSTSGGNTERSITYSGPPLRELLLRAGMGGPEDRGARFAVVEAVATDGYRAVFSWGSCSTPRWETRPSSS